MRLNAKLAFREQLRSPSQSMYDTRPRNRRPTGRVVECGAHPAWVLRHIARVEEVAAITRTRAIGILAVMLAAYALSLILLGIAVGFDHGAAKWLTAGGLSALAIGMMASVALRVALLVIDPRGRELWWAKASNAGRALRVGSLLIRVGGAVFVWGLAGRTLL